MCTRSGFRVGRSCPWFSVVGSHKTTDTLAFECARAGWASAGCLLWLHTCRTIAGISEKAPRHRCLGRAHLALERGQVSGEAAAVTAKSSLAWMGLLSSLFLCTCSVVSFSTARTTRQRLGSASGGRQFPGLRECRALLPFILSCGLQMACSEPCGA